MAADDAPLAESQLPSVQSWGEHLPAELSDPAPRPLYSTFYESRVARQRSRGLWGCLAAGAHCVALSPLPIVKTMSLYLLPLAYLQWIGLGLCVIGVATYVRAADYRRARRYLTEGHPGFAQVVGLVKACTLTVNGSPSQYAFVAQLNLNPDVDPPLLAEVRSNPFSAVKKDSMSTRFRVGDHVPIVWLPGELDKSVQIFDFLEAAPGHELVRGKLAADAPVWKLVVTVLGATAFFFSLLWSVYALERYQPLDFGFETALKPLVAGAVVGMIAMAAFAALSWRERRTIVERNQRATSAGEAVEALPPIRGPVRLVGRGLVMLFGGAFLGALITMCVAFTANALLDHSPAKRVPVHITAMKQTTHNGIFRHYTMKFRRVGDQHDSTLLSTPQHMDEFLVPFGIALVRQGRFGWPWVENIEPLGKAN